MLTKYYPIHSPDEIKNYLKVYVPLVEYQLGVFNINLYEFGILGDHLGLQVISGQEFDEVHNNISKYSEVIKEGTIHNRRNNTYRLHDFISVEGIELQSIEIFEPKPNAEISKLKPGIEHIAMFVLKYDDLREFFTTQILPIDKEVETEGSSFFKTKFLNLIEIEFRNDYLWKSLRQN